LINNQTLITQTMGLFSSLLGNAGTVEPQKLEQ